MGTKLATVALGDLAYFEHAQATLFGHPCPIPRTSYSEERGDEVFADKTVITDIWDKLVQAGIMPCSFTALDKVRIETGFKPIALGCKRAAAL